MPTAEMSHSANGAERSDGTTVTEPTKNQFKLLQTKTVWLQKQLAIVTTDAGLKAKQLQAAERENENLKAKVKEQDKAVKTAEEIMSKALDVKMQQAHKGRQLEEKVYAAVAEKNNLKTQMEMKEKELKYISKELQNAKAEVGRRIETITKQGEKLNEVGRENTKLKKDLAEKEADLVDKKVESIKKERELKRVSKQLQDAKTDNEGLQAQNDQAINFIELLQRQLKIAKGEGEVEESGLAKHDDAWEVIERGQ